jgi:glycosyltransferase involved in cell wall biosynthesis
MRQSLARADAVLAISECTKRDFVELLGADAARIHVVYPGVNPGFQPAHHRATCQPVLRRLEVRTPYLLYVGSLGPHKNVGTLIRVFRRLKQARGIPHQLVLGGRIAWGPEVVAAAQDLAETGDCRILDFVSTADLPILYGAADAFVFLSLYEGFGLPPLEAMASGTPVVVSNAAALPEVAGDAALQVPPTDEAAIAEAILRVVGDADLRRELSVKGLRQAARFTWARTVRQTLQVFGSATGDLP